MLENEDVQCFFFFCCCCYLLQKERMKRMIEKFPTIFL